MLATGRHLAHYEIVEPLGKGGMGEVYRAKDTKLGRDVAIKVLPEEFSQDEERLRRFQREAKVLASLNHPNIASIYGLEQSGSTHYLVLELVEGETLAERIVRGPIPVEEALPIATKIAEALEEAHERGIVHRDLKPANVKVTPREETKVLDFGLAKAFAEEAPEADSSMSPTRLRQSSGEASGETRAGVILGTAAYMSPEQAKGKEVDKRTDIFAFGAVLYEMLTGKKAFPGEDVSEVLAAVIKLEPDWRALPKDLPPRLDELLHRCLAKDPRNRRRDIGDVRFELLQGEPDPAAESRREKTSSWRAATVVAAATALVVYGLTWNWRAPTVSERPVVRFGLDLEFGGMGPGAQQTLAISPDGRRIAFSGSGGGGLYLRDLSALEGHTIAGTEGRSVPEPFFSPDGRWVGFYGDGRLQKISVLGGEPIDICETEPPVGLHWIEDGFILFATGTGGVQRVSDSGGAPETVVEIDAENGEFALAPQLLPDGETLLFTLRSSGDWDDSQVVAQSLTSGARTVLISGGRDARYVPPHFLVYGRGSTLLATRFDTSTLKVDAAPATAVVGVDSGSTGAMEFGVSDNGTLAYRPIQLSEQTALWVHENAVEEPLSMPGRAYRLPQISPEGRRIIAIVDSDLWVYDIGRDVWSRVTSSADVNFVAWATEDSVVFSSSRDGRDHLYLQTIDGTDVADQLTSGGRDQHVESVSPDGRKIIYHEHTGVRNDLWLLDLDASEEPKPLAQTEFTELAAQFSPDGDWIAYVSDERGKNDVYVRPIEDFRGSTLVASGSAPRWSPNGREIYYSDGERLLAVEVRIDGTVQLGEPRVVLDDPRYDLRRGPLAQYDISPDGEKFLVVSGGITGDAPTIQVVVNWTAELEQLMSSGDD